MTVNLRHQQRSDQREHVLDETCWCDPYPDSVEPSVIIHRKEGEAMNHIPLGSMERVVVAAQHFVTVAEESDQRSTEWRIRYLEAFGALKDALYRLPDVLDVERPDG